MEKTEQLCGIIDRLRAREAVSDEDYRRLLLASDPEAAEYLYQAARAVRESYYGKKVYMRGLIEFTNYCRNNCYYCGIRRDNLHAERYRLEESEICACAEEGYALGFRTFVLQGGEDGYYTKEMIGQIVAALKERHPDCAVTLSFGEWDYAAYQHWRACGADRYLLRHETADEAHYRRLHPQEMSLAHRKNCLRQLRELGYQVGAGFMVGSPGQTADHLIKDLHYLQQLQPHMVGIGPFIPQKDTPFAKEPGGTLELTLKLLAILRLLLPEALLPATTALGTIHPKGRELGILAGANVVMPNLSPVGVRKKYLLYDHKICTGEESAQCVACLRQRIASIGYELREDRGDSLVETHRELTGR